MKYTNTFYKYCYILALGWIFFVPLKTQAQSSCVPSSSCSVIKYPYPTYGGCYHYGLLDRYLSKSMMMAGLVDHYSQPDYCDHINLIKKLWPSYLNRIGGTWGLNESTYIPGGSAYNTTASVIHDIQSVYCNSGMRLPIFEAGIYEAVSTDVNSIPIPSFILSAFATDPDFIAAGYVSTPPTNFDVNEIKNLSAPAYAPGLRYKADANRIQTRMFYYYLATIYIDMGFQSLHMGVWQDIASNDINYEKSYVLFDMMRNYAISIGSFAIINADVDRALYKGAGGTQLILDFITYPIRPEPTLNPFTSLPCDGNNMAELHIAGYSQLLGYTGGISPQGCTIDNSPVLYRLDWSGVNFTGYPPSLGMGNGWVPWNVNESIWFYLLSPDCQAYWLKNTTYAVKNDITTRGYFNMPGILGLTWWGYPVKEYYMKDYSVVQDAVQNDIWKVNKFPYYSITGKCEKNCSGITEAKYILKVADPDCSSVYTWHVFNTGSGTWLNYTYGNERILTGLAAGTYEIFLRQDNTYEGSIIPEVQKELIVNPSVCSNSGGYFFKTTNNSNNGLNDSVINKKNTLDVYPNPIKDNVTIKIDIQNDGDVTVFLTNIEGAILKNIIDGKYLSKGIHSFTSNFSDIVSGTYFVQVKTEKENLLKQISIIH